MAEVWMARRRAMGGASKTVAIKLLAAHLAEKPVYRRMFVDEARLTMMLTHSNIVQVFDVGEQEGRSYLVMEWVDGLDLSRLAGAVREAGEALDFHVVAHVIGEMLRGLAYAHGLREGSSSSTVVHRDISPHNVLISVSGEVKVSDFGVARLASEETSGLHVRGKLRYMPPEQIRGESKEPSIDLFAVGATLQELLDGVRFRADLDRDKLFAMVIEGEVPAMVRRDVPRELVALRDGLLAADRKRRIQTAEDALALLRRWSGYRNAADELAGLVRRFLGVAAPRSGLTVPCSDEELETADEPTVQEGGGPARSSDLATRPHAGQLAASETTPSVGLDERPPAADRRRRPVMLGLAVATLGVSFGFGYAWLPGARADAAEHAPVEPALVVGAGPSSSSPVPVGGGGEEAPVEPSSQAPVPPADPGEAAADAKSEGPAPEQAEGEAAAEGEGAPSDRADSGRSKAKARGQRAAAAAPAQVEFAAHEFFFVWVKVRGRAVALEPLAKLSLPAGKHRVWLRERKDQPWRSAGSITVAGGGRYKVELEKPASLKLNRVD